MKNTSCYFYVLILSLFFCAFATLADKVTLLGDRTVTGTILQTNDGVVLLATDYGTLSYPQGIIKHIEIDRTQAAEQSKTNTFPDAKTVILHLNEEPWAADLKQIPATVIDKGILKNVPYISFRCGKDYEVNIYGGLDHPAGIEVGIYRSLLSDSSAKSNCMLFISDILGPEPDKAIIKRLDRAKDLMTFDGLTFEVTPPTAEDAYGGWWVSAYSEEKLNAARATDDELHQITVGNTDTKHSDASWNPDDLKLARPFSPYPSTITFTDSSGNLVTDAQVVRVIDGTSVIWKQSGSSGLVKLAGLPKAIQTQFGYDPSKAAAAEAEQHQKSAQIDAAVSRINAVQTAQVQDVSYSGDGSDYTGGDSSGGRVYVRGYTRSNGTYVQPYTRSAPHSR